jgi:RNA-directed DNA polymerase
MESLKRFLASSLRLKVNEEKSAVDRPLRRVFLGYTMMWHMKPRLKVALSSVVRLKLKLKKAFRRGRGRNLKRFIEELRPLLLGWVNYIQLAEARGIFEELAGWIRRKLRCIIFLQWKRPNTRAKNLM